MNNSQIKYAKARAEQIMDKRQRAIADKYSKQRKTLDDHEKLKALKAGKFSVVTPKDRYWRWHEQIKFTDEVAEDTEARTAELAKLRREYEKLIDELVLGDCKKALELLAKFEGVK